MVADTKGRTAEYIFWILKARQALMGSSSPIATETTSPTNIQQVTAGTTDSYNHQSIKELV